MRTIAIINQKGGCGKTTVAVNLAATLAAQGRKTLLVDMDPQSHCALGLAVPESQIDKSIGDLLRAGLDGSIAFADVLWQISRNLDLAPCTMALAGIEQELAAAPDKDRRLMQVLSTVQDDYEYCVIDCPPAIGLLTFNALRASAEVIIPVETGYFSMQGAIRQEATIQMLARRANHTVRFMVLATMYDVRTKLAREILSELRRHFSDKLMPVVVHFNSKLKEAASFGQAISEYDPNSTGYEDFVRLAEWLVANPPQRGEGDAPAAASPALSRAAELVERARALSARSAALSAKLGPETELLTQSRGRPLSASPQGPGFISAPTPSPADAPAAPAPAPVAASAPNLATALVHAFHAGALASPVSVDPLLPNTAPRPPITQHPRTGQTPAAGSDAAASAAVATMTATEVKPRIADKLAKIFGVRPTAKGLLFIQPANGAKTVAIAGDFNDWTPALHPMVRDETLNVWQAVIPVPPGRYRYRLVIDGCWTSDPFNRYVESNPFGELNNVIEYPLP